MMQLYWMGVCALILSLVGRTAGAAEPLPGSVDNGNGSWTYRYAPSGGANDGSDQGGPSAGKDLVVAEHSPSTVFAYADDEMGLYNSSCNPFIAWGLLRFDLAGLPSASQVERVNLVFHSKAWTAYFPYQVATTTYDVYRVTEAWEENTATWNNQPAVAADPSASLGVATAEVQHPSYAYDGFVSIPITSLYLSWISGQQANHGLSLRRRESFCENGNANQITTSDASEAARRPALEIVYRVAPLQPDAGPAADGSAPRADAAPPHEVGIDSRAAPDAGTRSRDAAAATPLDARRSAADAARRADRPSGSGCALTPSAADLRSPWLLLLALIGLAQWRRRRGR
ncbi:MAG: DNRLRE domain-containing protein [Proteobacteria bacterium]|nr:DNRLRE domain-containing protein [Pseudomonadota bacterium]